MSATASEGADIAALEKRVDELAAQLRAAQSELHNARLAAAPVKTGEVVRSTSKRMPGVFRVCSVAPTTWRDKPWVSGNPKKKDGSFGTAIRNLYSDWEKV